MTVRQATAEDLPQLLAIGERFWSISPWAAMGLERDDIAICEQLEAAISEGGCFVCDGGVIFGRVWPVWASPSNLIAVELAWYGPGNGRALREAFEAWAKERGCIGVQMSTLGAAWDEDTVSGLRSAGYAKAEQGWFKRI
jgi:GNAT superfamily N-acetyltransferase